MNSLSGPEFVGLSMVKIIYPEWANPRRRGGGTKRALPSSNSFPYTVATSSRFYIQN